ncbi:MAG: hypothetical protein ACRDSR_22485 [Pseudonocardiaceae bacterium]
MIAESVGVAHVTGPVIPRMSPVSRTRKTKKSPGKRGAPRRRTQDALTSPPRPAFAAMRARPAWFDPSIKTVLEAADVDIEPDPEVVDALAKEWVGAPCPKPGTRLPRIGSTSSSR